MAKTLPAQTAAEARLYRKGEMPLVWHLRKMDSDTFAEEYQRELAHLDFLESTKRHKTRIAAQRRKLEVFTNVAAEA